MRTLTLSLLFVVLIATIGLGWMFDNLYGQYGQNGPDQPVDGIIILKEIGSSLAHTLDQLPDRREFVRHWQSNGRYPLDIVALKDFQLPGGLLDDMKAGNPLLLETSSHLAFHYYLSNSDELLILKSPLLNIKQADNRLNYLFTILFYLALLVMFLVWVYPLIRQLLSLRQVAKAFGEGKLKQRVTIGPISYIRDIEVEFNHMAQRIENLVNDVKLLSSAVSHDLRTPLARIRFGVDTLQEEDDPILRRRFEQKISDNVDEMTTLVETLLNYARLDQAMIDVKKDNVSLSALIANSIKLKTTESVAIHFQQPASGFEVYGDAAYLSMLVNNVLQNAIQYCHAQVSVSLIEHHDKVELIIADDGDGIAPQHRDNILKPLVRGDHTQQTVKGHGIGLAIVKRIVDWHQGSIEISDSSALCGAEFTIGLPKP